MCEQDWLTIEQYVIRDVVLELRLPTVYITSTRQSNAAARRTAYYNTYMHVCTTKYTSVLSPISKGYVSTTDEVRIEHVKVGE